MYYLNCGLKNLLSKRSIFDILMDIWFLPSISEYLLLLIKPFIYKMPPQEAILLLEDVDPDLRKMCLTKVKKIKFFIFIFFLGDSKYFA